MSTVIVDKNLVTDSQLELEDVRFYDLPGEPFAIYGVSYFFQVNSAQI